MSEKVYWKANCPYEPTYKEEMVDDYVLDNFIWDEKDQVWREEEPQ
jgi:hypothetical protein